MHDEEIIEFDITDFIIAAVIVVLSFGWFASAMKNSELERELARQTSIINLTKYVVRDEQTVNIDTEFVDFLCGSYNEKQ